MRVDHFDLREQIIKDDARLLAAVDHNRVDFAFNLHNAAFAFVNVDRLLHVGDLDHNLLVVFVMLPGEEKEYSYTQSLGVARAPLTIIHVFPFSSSVRGGFCAVAAAAVLEGEPLDGELALLMSPGTVA